MRSPTSTDRNNSIFCCISTPIPLQLHFDCVLFDCWSKIHPRYIWRAPHINNSFKNLWLSIMIWLPSWLTWYLFTFIYILGQACSDVILPTTLVCTKSTNESLLTLCCHWLVVLWVIPHYQDSTTLECSVTTYQCSAYCCYQVTRKTELWSEIAAELIFNFTTFFVDWVTQLQSKFLSNWSA